MKFLSFNVNGLAACLNKGLADMLASENPDIAALQEVKANAPAPEFPPNGRRVEWNFAERRGYAGTACLFKKRPLTVTRGIGIDKFDADGRVVTLEYPSFSFVNVYVPNSQGGLAKWYRRLEWDEAFYDCIAAIMRRKPVIIGGDFNVAHEVIDTCHAEPTAGFREEEREGFDRLLSLGLVDTFRSLNPGAEGAYTWWSGKNGGRAANLGRRLDYFLVSESIAGKITSANILPDIQGSDHAPITLEASL
jgi:exodeoxyribonuclease-3